MHDSSTHDHRKLAKERTDVFCFPCVYSVNRNNVPSILYSDKKSHHMGVPKVIWGSGATGFVLDVNGAYGLTEWASAITGEDLEKILIALRSDKFQSIIKSTSMAKSEFDWKMARLFCKDFWKSFI